MPKTGQKSFSIYATCKPGETVRTVVQTPELMLPGIPRYPGTYPGKSTLRVCHSGALPGPAAKASLQALTSESVAVAFDFAGVLQLQGNCCNDRKTLGQA
eukprot:2709893-Rhodomonas_salina.1